MKTVSIQLKPFTSGDEQEIARIILDNAYYDNMELVRKIRYEDFHSEKNLKEYIKQEKPDILFAVADGRKVGVIIRKKNRFLRLHVARDYIKMGVGSLLMKEMIARCQKEGYVSGFIKPLKESKDRFIKFLEKNKIEVEKVTQTDSGTIEIYFKL